MQGYMYVHCTYIRMYIYIYICIFSNNLDIFICMCVIAKGNLKVKHLKFI